MKLLFENWRQFLTEKKWEDFDHPKGQWADVSPDDIKSSQDPINVDLSDELFDLIDNA